MKTTAIIAATAAFGIAAAANAANTRGPEDKVREAIRLAVRRCATEWTGKKPVVDVLLVRV